MSIEKETAILQVALQPITGPWSVMRELAAAQRDSQKFAGIGIGVITYDDWPDMHRKEMLSLGIPAYEHRTPKMFGTASYLWQRIRKPPLKQWMADLARRTGAKRVVAHFHNAWLSGVFLPVPRLKGVQTGAIVTVNGVNSYFQGQPIRHMIHRWMTRRIARHGATLTSVDQFNVPLIESVLGYPQSQVIVIPNGVRSSPLTGCPILRENSDGVFRVGFVGGLVPAKGWRMSVDAVLELSRRGHRVQILLAGGLGGAPEAKALADAHPAVVKYLGQIPDPREKLMTQVDVLTLLSEREGLPMVILEAMSIGVPSISTRVGGVPEAIQDGENGLLIERSTEALIKSLESLIADPQRLRTMHAGSRKTFDERYEVGRVADQFARLYAAAKMRK